MPNPTAFLSRLGRFVLIPIGLLLLAGACYSVWSTTNWLKRTVEAQGTVIEMLRVRDSSDDSWLYEPVVRFETAEGKTIRFESSFRSRPPAYHVGETVRVLYLPEAPESAAIRGFLSLWMLPVILGFIGATFFGIGGGMLVLSCHASLAFARDATA